MNSRRRICWVIALIALLFHGFVYGQHFVGTLRIDNPHSFPVEVYSQNFDGFGRPFWVQLTTVPPKGFVTIPGVPNGAVIGLQTPGAQQIWNPIQVFYQNPYNPFAVIAVPFF